ncbi:hypothetical protein D3C74_56350 [compost metagenome]
MTERILCRSEDCTATILPTTAAKTGGYCMPCHQGMERRKWEEYVAANRRTVNLYAHVTGAVDILKVMYTEHPRDPLIEYLPYEKSKEEFYVSLSIAEQERMLEYAMDQLREGDQDICREVLTSLVCYNELQLTEYLLELLEHEIYYPAMLYKDASPELREQLIQRVETDEENRNHLLMILAWIGDDVIVKQFKRWSEEAPSWSDSLYVRVQDYAKTADWELTDTGERRDLYRSPSYAMITDGDHSHGELEAGVYQRSDGLPGKHSDLWSEHQNQEQYQGSSYEPSYDQSQKPFRLLTPATDSCPWCGVRLTHLVDMEANHPSLGGMSWNGVRLKVKTCILCSCYTTVYMDIAADGEPKWSISNERPDYLPELQAEDFDQGYLAAGSPYRLAEQPRPALHGSEWTLEPSLSQMGGHPAWIQDAYYPECPCCSKSMLHIGQIDWAAIERLGEGIYYMYACEDCCKTAVTFQQT